MQKRLAITAGFLGLICLLAAPEMQGADPPTEKQEVSDATVDDSNEDDASESGASENIANRRNVLIASLTIFVLAIFVGFEVITKVPPTLHTPLMSGSNAISGITVVGALLAAGSEHWFVATIGMFAVALATINVVGGFLVTHRMLAMFRKKR